MTFDPIALIEEAYRPQKDTGSWLRANAPAISAPFDSDGNGTFWYVVEDRQPRGIEWAPRGAGGLDPESAAQGVLMGFEHAAPEQLERVYLVSQQPGVHGLVETIGGMIERTISHIETKVADSPAVMIPVGDGRTALVATITSEVLSVDRETRELWERIALHLGAACRLAGRAPDPDAPDVEAVLDPGGGVRHAREGASSATSRERLRDAVQSLDRVRTRQGRADPLAALDTWQGLLAGRWSLVDHFDSDGRRFLLARRNDPDVRDPATLSPRQRQVLFYASIGWSLKQIAYALGLAEGTINRHLAVALRKVGMASRAELVRVTTDLAMRAMRTE